MKDSRIEKLAEVVVNYSVSVGTGDLVVIQGTPICEPLIIALYESVVAAGGHPEVRMAPDNLTEIMLKKGSDAQLDYIGPLAMHDIEKMDAGILVSGEVNTKSLSNTDPSKHARLLAARRPIFSRFSERAAAGELRWTVTDFPTQSSAQDAGMSLSEYEEFVYGAGLLHLDDPITAWEEIGRKQQYVVDLLNGKETLHLETPNGTDLNLDFGGRKWINCCGKENFPDGEVFTSPLEDSVEGTICFSFPVCHMGHECKGVTLRFEKGKVMEASAEQGEEFLLQMLDQDEGARLVGEFAIGTNYAITQFSKNTLFDEKIGGTVHLAVGAGIKKTGGVNESGLHWDMVCDLRSGGQITVDGEVIHENGKFTSVDL